MENQRPLILISNDDGIIAKGISELIKFLRPLGEIVVMAPDAPRSGSASALTVTEPIRYQLLRKDVGLTVYKCSGTPADCVKLAFHTVLDRKPDLVVGGINHGDNSSVNVHYSGICDSRKKIVKLVTQTCRVKSFQNLEEKDKRSYVMEKCRELNIQIEHEALNQLIQRLKNDTATIDRQLEKLACYPQKIDEEVINALVLRELEDNVFQLSESILNGKFKKAYRLYKDMTALNYDPIYLLAVISSQMRFYYQVKVCLMQGMNEERIASYLKAHPYRVKLSIHIVDTIDAEVIMKILDAALMCDLDIKNGRREKFLAFEMFLIRCQEEIA